MIQFIQVILSAAAIYMVVGIFFSIPFYLKGINKIDDNAEGSTLGFRLIIFPGIVMFWPMLLRKWMKNINKI